jgi:glycosyltransferase involved in cell wall biosynthesis
VAEPLNIAFVASASIHSKRWIKFFADRGHKVTWLVTSLAGHEPPELPHRLLSTAGPGSKAITSVQAAFEVRAALAELKPDVVHAHYAGVPGVITALSGQHPFILTAWGSDVLFAAPRPIFGLPIRWALKKADLVTCDAQHMIDAVGKFGVPRQKLHRINFGTDVDRFKPVPRSAEIDRRLNLGPGPRVISIRNLQPVYDIATLVRAVPQVCAAVPDATFIIGGTGPDEAALKSLAAELGVTDRIRFCGSVKNDELPLYYAAADVYVSTALSDAGLSASTAEAMACGVAVVVSNTGENHLWVESGKSGFLFPAKDSEQLGSQLTQLLTDTSLRTRLASQGRALIVEKSNYSVELEKMERLCLDLARGASHGH